MGVIFVGFVCWVALSTVPRAVVAPSHWVVESRRQDVLNPEGGQIARLLVREGDRVAAGDILITFEARRTEEQVAAFRAQLASTRLSLVLLRVEQLDDAGLPTDQGLMERARGDQDLMMAIEAQRSAATARQAVVEAQMPILNDRIRQLRDQIAGLIVQDRSRIGQIDTLRRELDMVIELLRGGHTTRPRALGLEREIARLEGERGEQAVQLARLEQSIGDVELQILQLRRGSAEERAVRLEETMARMAGVREQIGQMDIRAPVSGIVAGLMVSAQGEVITAGQVLMQIAPDDGRLLVTPAGVVEGLPMEPGTPVRMIVGTETRSMMSVLLDSLTRARGWFLEAP